MESLQKQVIGEKNRRLFHDIYSNYNLACHTLKTPMRDKQKKNKKKLSSHDLIACRCFSVWKFYHMRMFLKWEGRLFAQIGVTSNGCLDDVNLLWSYNSLTIVLLTRLTGGWYLLAIKSVKDRDANSATSSLQTMRTKFREQAIFTIQETIIVIPRSLFIFWSATSATTVMT